MTVLVSLCACSISRCRHSNGVVVVWDDEVRSDGEFQMVSLCSGFSCMHLEKKVYNVAVYFYKRPVFMIFNI